MIPSPIGWLTGLLSWFGAVFVFLAALLAGGCAPNATEIERFSDRVFLEVIGPAVQKAIAETSTRTATLQGGAQVIEPGYAINVEGFWGTGIKASTVVRVVGVSGQLTGHAQADQGQAATVPPPATREESTELPGPPASAAPGG